MKKEVQNAFAISCMQTSFVKFTKFLIMFFLLQMFLCGTEEPVFAQTRNIKLSGLVNDEAGTPIPGVTVVVKGTDLGTITNSDGKYTLDSPQSKGILVFSFIGLQKQELPFNGKGVYNIAMKSASIELDEVVVVGYGQVKKRDLTGSVTSIRGTEITKIPTTTPIEALQGKIPGADIFRDNGYAGGGANIRLRGTRSIGNPSSSNNVLYIIDGVQGVSMSDVDPNDIQSMDVLKDASSTSIYGSRGANGVIIITTKRGTSNKPQVTFNTYSGISNVSKYGRMKSGPEYIDFKREAYRAVGTWNSPADDSKIFNPLELNAIQQKQYVNWSDLLLNPGSQQDYQVGISGGSDKTKIYFSAGYYHEKGILQNDDFKRYTTRFNIDQTINNWLKVGVNSQFANINNDIRRDPFNFAAKAIPLGLPYDSLGNVVMYPVGGTQRSPLSDDQPGQWVANTKTNRFSGAFYAELTPFKDLNIRSTFSTTQQNVVAGNYFGKESINGGGSKSQSSINNSQNNFMSWENVMTYKKEINNHSFTLTGVTSYLQTISTTSFAQGQNQLFPIQGFYNLAAANQNGTYGSGYVRSNLLSFTGRMNYSYLGKYLFTVTGRSDESSKLGEGNKWAFFPSAAIGWRISDEAFMKNQKVFDNLKLRVSYGISGNDVIGAYATQGSLSQIQYSYNDATPSIAYGINPTIGNGNLKWELTATKDIGLDFSVANKRISGTIEYYDAITSNLIFPYTLPGSTGVATMNLNVGKTRNQGVEVSLTSINIAGQSFRWSSTITYSRNKEEIMELPNGNVYASDYRNSLIVGQSPTIYYDYVKLGLWQLGEEVEAAKFGALPGDIKIADLWGPNGTPDGKITADDRTVIGTRVPKWIGGFSNDLSFKNFDLNVLVIARFGQWMSSDYYAKYYRNAAQNGNAMDYWTPENPTNAYPRPNATRSSSYVTTLTEYVNSYVKLRNITIGYTLPKSISEKIKVANIRFYVTGKNLYFISKYNKDFDPESEGIVDAPLSKLFIAGLNVTF